MDAISPAFEHARQQLTRPFRASQWAKLGLVGLLAGEMGSGGGGCNPGSFQMPTRPNNSQHLFAALPSVNPMVYASLIAVLVVTGLVLLVLFLYVNSVMRFVLFDSVVAKDCRIWHSWSRRQGPGRRFFIWQILLAVASIVVLTILVGIPAGFAFLVGWLRNPKEHMIPLILGGMALFFVFLLFVVVQLLIHVMTKDFVVPQMAMEEIGAIEGWRRLWPQIKQEKGGYAAYIGMKIVMAIGAAIGSWHSFAIVILLFADSDRWVGRSSCDRWHGGRAHLEPLHHHTGSRSGSHCAFLSPVFDFSDFGAGRGVLSGVFHLFLRLALSRAGRAAASCAATCDCLRLRHQILRRCCQRPSRLSDGPRPSPGRGS